MGWRVVAVLLAAALFPLLAACGAAAPGAADHPIAVYLVPSGDARQAAAAGEELAGLLEDRTGLAFDVRMAADAAAVREAMGAGAAHVGWLDALSYVQAHEEYGAAVALVAVRAGANSYNGQVIVRAGGGVVTLADLKGKTMCWVDSSSTSGFIIPRIMLAANGVDPDQDFGRTVTSGSDADVVLAVYHGTCDAGATFSDARALLEPEYPDVMARVAVLATTTAIPNEGVVFAQGLPPETRERVIAALLEIAGSAPGQTVLGAIAGIEGLQPFDDSYYDLLRADLAEAGVSIVDLIK